jgi:hypothetical protein
MLTCSSRGWKKAAQLRRIEIPRVITTSTIQATLLSLEPGEKTEPCGARNYRLRTGVSVDRKS